MRCNIGGDARCTFSWESDRTPHISSVASTLDFVVPGQLLTFVLPENHPHQLHADLWNDIASVFVYDRGSEANLCAEVQLSRDTWTLNCVVAHDVRPGTYQPEFLFDPFGLATTNAELTSFSVRPVVFGVDLDTLNGTSGGARVAFSGYMLHHHTAHTTVTVGGINCEVVLAETEAGVTLDPFDLVFRQTAYHGYFDDGEWTKNDRDLSARMFSRLAALEDSYSAEMDGFVFKLLYPEMKLQTRNVQIWKQASNPIMSAPKVVEGFESILSSFDLNGWGGLARSKAASNSLLDGSVVEGYTDYGFFAIGTLGPDANPGMYGYPELVPGPYGPEEVVELYVLSPAKLDSIRAATKAMAKQRLVCNTAAGEEVAGLADVVVQHCWDDIGCFESQCHATGGQTCQFDFLGNAPRIRHSFYAAPSTATDGEMPDPPPCIFDCRMFDLITQGEIDDCAVTSSWLEHDLCLKDCSSTNLMTLVEINDIFCGEGSYGSAIFAGSFGSSYGSVGSSSGFPEIRATEELGLGRNYTAVITDLGVPFIAVTKAPLWILGGSKTDHHHEFAEFPKAFQSTPHLTGLEFYRLPFVATNPMSKHIVRGRSAYFRCVVESDDSLAYQWYHDGTPLSDGTSGKWTGSTNWFLRIASVQSSDQGSYACRATVQSGPFAGVDVHSKKALLTVDIPTAIVTGPSSQTLPSGSLLELSCEVSGTPPIFIEWAVNGLPLTSSAGTSSLLSLNNTSVGDGGDYTCTAVNLVDWSTSVPATVVIIPPPTFAPTALPTRMPTLVPTAMPTVVPSAQPTLSPTLYPTSACTNGVQDVDESDVDCGGSSCRSCVVGSSCRGDADCRTGKCSGSGVCATRAPTESPTKMPTLAPTTAPTFAPTSRPAVGATDEILDPPLCVFDCNMFDRVAEGEVDDCAVTSSWLEDPCLDDCALTDLETLVDINDAFCKLDGVGSYSSVSIGSTGGSYGESVPYSSGRYADLPLYGSSVEEGGTHRTLLQTSDGTSLPYFEDTVSSFGEPDPPICSFDCSMFELVTVGEVDDCAITTAWLDDACLNDCSSSDWDDMHLINGIFCGSGSYASWSGSFALGESYASGFESTAYGSGPEYTPYGSASVVPSVVVVGGTVMLSGISAARFGENGGLRRALRQDIGTAAGVESGLVELVRVQSSSGTATRRKTTRELLGDGAEVDFQVKILQQTSGENVAAKIESSWMLTATVAYAHANGYGTISGLVANVAVITPAGVSSPPTPPTVPDQIPPQPDANLTAAPTTFPSDRPTRAPSASPSESPTEAPTGTPTTASPTASPTERPTHVPTVTPELHFFGLFVNVSGYTEVNGSFTVGWPGTSGTGYGHATLFCNVTGIPEPGITWHLNGNVLSHTSAVLETFVSGSTDQYFCTAANTAGTEQSDVATIASFPIPSVHNVTTSATNLWPGDTAVLACAAEGFESHLLWMRGTTVLEGENAATLTVGFSLRGTEEFTCVAYNRAGESAESVFVASYAIPKVGAVPSILQPLQGTALQIECSAVGAAISWQWFHDSHLLNATAGAAVGNTSDIDPVPVVEVENHENGDGSSSILKVASVEFGLSGAYSCVARSFPPPPHSPHFVPLLRCPCYHRSEFLPFPTP
jgi:hypothetical protein